jgi:hypothetical protein
VKQLVNEEIISLQWKSTKFMLADLLTKALTVQIFTNLRDQIINDKIKL